MPTTTALKPQHTLYSHLLSGAKQLLEKYAVGIKPHLIATGVTMRALAQKFGGDPDTWQVAGMLHDLDWDQLQKDYSKHCEEPLERMLAEIGAPPELLADLRSHYQAKFGSQYPLDSLLRRALYTCEELTGFIVAVTLVRPSKKIADVEVSSVRKKMKDKAFAAQVDREQIKKCEELLGLPLDELIAITLSAMKSIAGEIGL
jgi:predicted hydrolase (HD superfamily)